MKEEYRYTSFCECTVEAPMIENNNTHGTSVMGCGCHVSNDQVNNKVGSKTAKKSKH